MTALNLTPDEALALADQWCAGLTMNADSKGWGAILLVLAEEVRRLRMELEHEEQRVADMMADVNRVGHELDAVYDLLPSHYYMDPPDGGDVPLLEQLRRMAKDAARYRWLRAEHEPADLPIAQVVWKRGNDPHGDWVNLVDGGDLDRHIDTAMEATNAG